MAQDVFESSILVKTSVLIEVPMMVPSDLQSGESVPLVIGLHGGGGSPEQFKDIWNDVPEADFLYVALRAPYPIPDQPAYEWASWTSADTLLMRLAGDLVPAYVKSAIEAVRLNYIVSAVYLVGFSQGAIYTYVTGMAIPDLLDGLLIFGGPGLLSPLTTPFIPEPVMSDWVSEDSIPNGSSLRVFIAHGKSDLAVEYRLAQSSCDILKANGYSVVFRAFNGGHQVPPIAILQEAALWIMSPGK
ncbi:alpha/beta hydrolase [Gemmatimonadota bacterium]